MNIEFDEQDQVILDERIVEWNKVEGPRAGDYVIMPDGEYRRFTYDWRDNLQTTVSRVKDHYQASFYFFGSGMSFSGSLDRAIFKDMLELTPEVKDGAAWFFHHGESGAHRGVHFNVPCRVYRVR